MKALGMHEVHVWQAALDVGEDTATQLARTLSAEEVRRADCFHDPCLRRRHVVSRATLRAVLGAYLGESPSALRLVQGQNGKPALAASELRFNLSHAEDVALVAVARGREVGVDIARVSPGRDTVRLAREFCSARERHAIGQLSPPRRVEAFFVCWVRKEALVKATGHGMSAQLLDLDVYPDARGAPAGWLVRDLPAPPGHVAALAGQAPAFGVRLLTWPPAGAAAPPEGLAPQGRAEQRMPKTSGLDREREPPVPGGNPLAA